MMEDTMREAQRQTSVRRNPFIRGVNLGGWLLLERFITPYMFALTDCHTRGDFCWFPGQISAPPVHSEEHAYCDMYHCEFILDEKDEDGVLLPIATDEFTLTKQFPSKWMAREYLAVHWDRFVLKSDIIKLKEAGVTHLRVPVPHWILGNIEANEPYVDGQWLYFVRLVSWCRELDIQVWPDIQTAPGLAEKSFPLIGDKLEGQTICFPWSESKENMDRGIQVVQEISDAIVRDGLGDVVTGLGVFNAPFADCDLENMKGFYNEALRTARSVLGEETTIFVADMLNASSWNTRFWTDEDEYANTLLESRSYHVFTKAERILSQKERIAQVCEQGMNLTKSCCYEDAPKNKVPSKGIARIVGEWSAAYGNDPMAWSESVMHDIRYNLCHDEADVDVNRTMTEGQEEYLQDFVKAQMVALESANAANGVDIARGWFFRNFKMEFGAFAEWDFLRGLEEGWIPTLPGSSESSASVYGSCEKIAEGVKDSGNYPESSSGSSTAATHKTEDTVSDDENGVPHSGTMPAIGGVDKDEDSLGKSSETTKQTTTSSVKSSIAGEDGDDEKSKKGHSMFPVIFVGFFGFGIWKVFFQDENPLRNRRQYTNLDTPTQLSV